MAEIDINKLEECVSNDGTYIIPVTWSVYSTLRVSGVPNLAEALKLVQNNLDNIPLGEGEYLDGSYEINDVNDADLLVCAQEYVHVGGSDAEISPDTFNR